MTVTFALGSNNSGQLGISHNEDVSVPKQVLFQPPVDTPVSKVAAGGNHTLILSKSGTVFCSGDFSSGACGRASEGQQQGIFHRLDPGAEGSSRTVLIAATWEASILVQEDEDGRNTRVYSLGLGQKGELGLGDILVRSPTATRIKDFPPDGTHVVDLAACMGHVVAILDNGDVYGWGNGRKGQLGAPAAVITSPRRIQDVGFKAVRAVCGREFTALFSDPSDGKILVLGSEKWGIKESAPQDVQGWREVGAGWSNIFVLKEDGKLMAWGRDDHGELPPENLPSLSQIAPGSEHMVALSANGEVLCWGWGEHGNCGPQVGGGVDVKGRWNVVASEKYIPPGSKIVGVGAGCATSWVFIDMPS